MNNTCVKYTLRVGYHLESGEVKMVKRTVRNDNIYRYVKIIANDKVADNVIGITLILDTYLNKCTNTHSIMLYRKRDVGFYVVEDKYEKGIRD